MTDNLTDRQKAERASRAKALLDNPLFQESFEHIRAQLIKQWEATPQRDTEGRERLHVMVTLLGMVKKHIAAHMVDGTVAGHRLDQEAKRSALTLFRNKH